MKKKTDLDKRYEEYKKKVKSSSSSEKDSSENEKDEKKDSSSPKFEVQKAGQPADDPNKVRAEVAEGKKQISSVRSYLDNQRKTFFKKKSRKDREIDKIFQKKEQIKKKKLTTFQRKRRLAEYIEKAGLDIDAQKVPKAIFFGSIALTVISAIITVIRFLMLGDTVGRTLIYAFLVITVGFIAFWLFLWLLFEVYLDIKMFRRKLELEEVLPDFLQLTSSNIRAGMPIDRALWFAVRPRFGVLAREIENVAKRTLSGEELEAALVDFAKKYDSPMLIRSIYLLNEGMAAGGDIGDLLNKIALNIMEMRTMKRDMSANVTTYVIFITFAAIMASPVLFALSNQLLEIVQTIAADVGSEGTAASGTGGMSLGLDKDAISQSDYFYFTLITIFFSSMFAAIIVSTIKKGNIKEGAVYIPVYIIVAIVAFFIANYIMGSLFGSMFG
jgi:Flp pilus assembly protein TadB